ncbi:MAG TPA: hypothetical protein VMU14_22880, partial [Acidimicrobiales bacterium]|nr:hypothetical protein [Acidimicrobiales bacterium]
MLGERREKDVPSLVAYRVRFLLEQRLAALERLPSIVLQELGHQTPATGVRGVPHEGADVIDAQRPILVGPDGVHLLQAESAAGPLPRLGRDVHTFAQQICRSQHSPMSLRSTGGEGCSTPTLKHLENGRKISSLGRLPHDRAMLAVYVADVFGRQRGENHGRRRRRGRGWHRPGGHARSLRRPCGDEVSSPMARPTELLAPSTTRHHPRSTDRRWGQRAVRR